MITRERRMATDDAAWSALMVRAQQGDKAAYHRLLTEITPFVRVVSARYAHNREDLEDTVQDVLMSLHSIRHTYEGSRPFLPWLATIAVRRAIDRVRGRRRHVGHEVALHPDHETFIAAEPKNELAGLEAAELRRAIERLPAGQRQAITILKLQEMSLEEAASLTGLSVTALKVATHRALQSLKLAILRT
jgi:RNA polymerase sigma factor (sigma-70 family)